MPGLYRKAAEANRSTHHFSQSSWIWRKCFFFRNIGTKLRSCVL